MPRELFERLALPAHTQSLLISSFYKAWPMLSALSCVEGNVDRARQSLCDMVFRAYGDGLRTPEEIAQQAARDFANQNNWRGMD